MPRSGDVYSKPAGTTAVSGTTIESAKFNSVIDDIAADLNIARPVVAGGTGATTVGAARTALGVPSLTGAETISGAWVYTANVTLNDNVAIRLGTGADTTFLHNGTNTIITDASSGLVVKTASFKVQNAAGTEDLVEAVQDSFVKLRHNNTARLTTTVTGVDISGDLEADTFSGPGVSTDIAADTGSTTKLPHVAAVEAYATKVLLATKTASASATLDFTEFVNATYHGYEFYFENVIPATDTAVLWMRTSTDAGSTYDSGASDYDWALNLAFSAGTTSSGGATATRIEVTGNVGAAANENGVNGMILLSGAALAAYTTVSGALAYTNASGGTSAVSFAGRRNAASDVTAVRFLFSTGNITSGKIRMYGLK